MLSVISRLTSCATRASPRGPSLALRAIHLVSRLRRVNRMCSRMVSDTANRLLKRTDSEGSSSVAEKKSSAVPPVSERSHIGNLRQIRKQGKGRSSKRKGNRRCPFLFALRRGRGESPRSAERSSPLRFSEKLSARQGRTRLRQFVCPGQLAQKRSRPSGANPPAAVRVPWSPCAEKRKAPQNCFHGAQSMHFYSNRSSVSTSLRAGACGSCAG